MNPLQIIKQIPVRYRARLRRLDAETLWPVLLEKAGRRPSKFLSGAVIHIAVDPAWRDPAEWKGTSEDPDVWLRAQGVQQFGCLNE